MEQKDLEQTMVAGCDKVSELTSLGSQEASIFFLILDIKRQVNFNNFSNHDGSFKQR